jgi:hypothetical protein
MPRAATSRTPDEPFCVITDDCSVVPARNPVASRPKKG